MDIFPVDWLGRDVDDQYTITLFGKKADGALIATHITFYPYFFVRIPKDWGSGQIKLFITEASVKYKALPQYCRTVERVSMWGFTNGEKVPMVQLAFASSRKMKWAARQLHSDRHLTTYESSMDPLLRFFHIRDIAPAQWVRVHTYSAVADAKRTTRAALEWSTQFDAVGPSAVTQRAPIIIGSWDIETYSASRRFPCPENEEDKIIQIATSFHKYGDPAPYRQLVLCLGDTGGVPGVEVVSFEREEDLINAWFDEVASESVDILLGYNTDQVWSESNNMCQMYSANSVESMRLAHTFFLNCHIPQFDWRYVHGRSLICVDDMTGDPLVEVAKLGRLREGGGVLQERELNSGAYGQNKFATLTTPGILQLDLLQHLRKEVKLDSYSLNNVSAKYLGDSKLDLPAGELFDKFDGSATDRAVIAEYAAKDTLLPLQLLGKLCVYENLAEMANATHVPLDYVNRRGQQVMLACVQATMVVYGACLPSHFSRVFTLAPFFPHTFPTPQIKVFSVLMKKARSMGFACPDDVGIGVVGKFTGATVLNAERGAYFDIVAGLDFASLYPSILRAWNLDYSTIVLDPKFDNLPGVEYYEVEGDQGTFRFAQGVPSVLPALLEDLAQYRKAAKKKMAEAKARGDTFAAAIHNGAQLAFKITMNSAYGFTGANKGFLSCVPIAASVTATGRLMIQKTKALVEETVPGSRVVYGDSVAGYTPVVVRDRDGVRITTMERLAVADSVWDCSGDKEFIELDRLEVRVCVCIEMWAGL